MAKSSTNSNGGSKTLLAVLSGLLVAMICGAGAMIHNDIGSVSRELVEHEKLVGHVGNLERLDALDKKLKEVRETQREIQADIKAVLLLSRREAGQ